ncbi:hypothetical protein OG417_50595 [Actinoallomurus sp. NBC_01490]|nr:hypothetical protein [Actinoallomurus sp. NBC_01490]
MSISGSWTGLSDQIHSLLSFQRSLVAWAQRHVVEVEQHLVLALLVPHLTAGVARILQDDANGALGPRDAAAVTVALAVVRRRR